MEDLSQQCPLPRSVEKLLKLICEEQSQPPPEIAARRELAALGEEQSINILTKIRRSKITKTFTGFIIYMAKESRAENILNSSPNNKNYLNNFEFKLGSPCNNFILPSPSSRASPVSSCQGSNSVASSGTGSSQSGSPTNSVKGDGDGSVISFISDKLASITLNLFGSSKRNKPSRQFKALEELGFTRAFLVLSYMGGRKLEDVASLHEVRSLVVESRNLTMGLFEKLVWEKFGEGYCSKEDRMRYQNWDSPGRYYYYHCHVHMDGSYAFKGPYINTRLTLLQKVVKEENVLVVKFVDEGSRRSSMGTGSFAALEKVARDGIYFGPKCYRFFAFKNGEKGEKKKNDPMSSSCKCYFVNTDVFAQSYSFDNKSPRQARSAFMHLDTLPSLSKYAARLELALSKTLTLPINLNGEDMHIIVIEDIPCKSANGDVVKGEDGKDLIHTDGTGFISEDLALRCPRDYFRGKFLNEGHVGNSLEFNDLSSESSELPLLMQFRLFHKGYAVKGTVLLNKKLPRRTIQVRPSMVKVCKDPARSGSPTVSSFEVVAISDRPKKSYLSKYLTALLHYGGVPKKFFTNILKNTLAEAQTSLTNKRAALQVALVNGNMDDDFTVARMLLSGIPLNEPYIQTRLPVLATQIKRSLKDGKLPIDESFYLMGTADPTGTLEANEVCIIHENGQISGKVLVYRNPGIHFGDIHVLTAKHIEGLEEIVGNSKYGIFFPTKGPRSLADTMAGGDFDGDLYWVSRNSGLLKYFKQSEPWTCMKQSSNSCQKEPALFSDEELENELFSRFLAARFHPSKAMGVASNSWLAYMDQMLCLDNKHAEERSCLKEKMLKLVDIYYEALDAPKNGNKVTDPRELVPDAYPHYMEMTRSPSYQSKSVLGVIYDEAREWKLETPHVPVWKLQNLDVEVPKKIFKTWQCHYDIYRKEMAKALSSTDDEDTKKERSNQVVQKYKQILYEAADFESSPRAWEELRVEALAIYNVSYNYAMENDDARKCGFAWRVAGSVLVKIFIQGQDERPVASLPSVLCELFTRK